MEQPLISKGNKKTTKLYHFIKLFLLTDHSNEICLLLLLTALVVFDQHY